MTKKIIFWVSLVGTLYILIVIAIGFGNYCHKNILCEKFYFPIDLMGINIFVFPAIFFPSLVMIRMKNEVYNLWLKFFLWCVPVYIVLLFLINITYSEQGGGFGLPDFSGFNKAFFTLLLLILFMIISFIIIVAKKISIRKKSIN